MHSENLNSQRVYNCLSGSCDWYSPDWLGDDVELLKVSIHAERLPTLAAGELPLGLQHPDG